jgi:hypothetical protein
MGFHKIVFFAGVPSPVLGVSSVGVTVLCTVFSGFSRFLFRLGFAVVLLSAASSLRRVWWWVVGCVSWGFLLSATFRQLSSESELVVCDLCGGCLRCYMWLAVVVVRFFMGVWRSTGISPLLG